MGKRNKAGKFERNGDFDLVDPLFVRLRPQLKAMLARYAESQGLSVATVVDMLIAAAVTRLEAPSADIVVSHPVAPKGGKIHFKVPPGKPHRFY